VDGLGATRTLLPTLRCNTNFWLYLALCYIRRYTRTAKYYEHKKRDAKASLEWAKSAREEAERADLPAYIRRHWLDEIDHRLARLERKAGL
jgi:hypothetical protein